MHGLRSGVVGAVLVSVALVSASCGRAPSSHRQGAHAGTTTTTTTTTSPPSATSSTTPGIAVPNVVGMQNASAKFYLLEAGFRIIPLTPACDRATPASQSIVLSLEEPGNAQLKTSPVLIVPGELRPKGSYVGITWSGCFPNGTIAPRVTGMPYVEAIFALHKAGLTWACYSTPATATTTKPPATSTTKAVSATTTTNPPATSTTSAPPTSALSHDVAPGQRVTTRATGPVGRPGSPDVVGGAIDGVLSAFSPQLVLTQNPPPGTTMKAGSAVTITMHACPQ